MTPDWTEIERLFFDALQRPEAERETWIREAAPSAAMADEVLTLLEAHAASEAPERRVGPYRLEKRIGTGGMGQVWLAFRADGQFEQRVAVKLVRSGFGTDDLVYRFQQERQLLAGLNHPNIARLLDGGITADGQPYLVMEYVEGEAILEYCERRQLGMRERIALFRQLCGALEYAHRNLIVHRDIKPANVLVTTDGTPKLLDFGIAKLIESGAKDTATAALLLTPRYASPEQLRGDPVTTATDVYSLAMLLFEMLSGSLAYHVSGDTPAAIVAAITTQEFQRLSAVSGRIPRGDLDWILAKAMDKEPRQRYGSVESFSAELGNFLEGRPVTARKSTVWYRAAKYVRRHRGAAAAACVVAVSLASASVLSMRAAREAKLGQARSERAARFLEDLVAAADPSWEGTTVHAGPDAKLTDLLPAARERLTHTFAGDPAGEARLHLVLGRAYTSLQQYPEAEAELRHARELLPALGESPAEKARILFASGWLDFLLSHRDSEVRELQQALEIFERTPELLSDATEHARYMAALAEALADAGNKAEATQTAGRVVQMMAAPHAGVPVKEGIIEGHLALVYMKTGNLEQARAAAARSIGLLEKSPKPLKELAEMEMWLGTLDRVLGDPAAALHEFERSVQATLSTVGTDVSLAVGPRVELAFQRAMDGQAADEIPELQRCLSLARAGSNREDLFRALHGLGYALTQTGHLEEAERTLREAVRVALGFLSPNGPSMAVCNLDLGECLERRGRVPEALALYESAAKVLRDFYGPVAITRRAEECVERARRGR